MITFMHSINSNLSWASCKIILVVSNTFWLIKGSFGYMGSIVRLIDFQLGVYVLMC